MTDATTRLEAALAERYRIERELGQGGMATVYLAEDVRHRRKVALKVLKPELAAVLGADRFLQEIATTASLQHPNILPLFDSGSADGFLYYVMPFVEGESLRQRLDRERQLPVLDATRIATHVADALHYAHTKGVIHRDIKPENILLQGGHTVVADFGIALAISNAGGSRVTQTGLTVGTPQYMSPEQASAERTIDGRSDVFSLGAVCYEMLAGEAPFAGPTAHAVITRMLSEPPRPLTSLRPSVSEAVADAVHRALEKIPADRWATAGEFAAALNRQGQVALRRSDSRYARKAMFGGAMFVAFVAGALLSRSLWRAVPETPERQPRRWAIQLPDSAIFAPTSDESWAPRQALAVSRDGNQVAYVGTYDGRSILHLYRLADGSVTPLPGTAGARLPEFSPDGRWIAFVADGEVRKVALDGGAVVRLAPVQSPIGLFWWSNERLLVSRSAIGPASVPAAGGRVEALGEKYRALSFVHTQVLPGEQYLLGSTAYGDLGVVSLATGALTFITAGEPAEQERASFGHALRGINPRFLASGYLVYASGASLMAVPFDPQTLRTRGRPAPIVSDLRNEGGAGETHFAVSDDGTLVYAPGSDGSTGRLMWVDRTGKTGSALPVRASSVLAFRLSRDGRRLAVTERLPNSPAETFIVNLQNGTENRARLSGEFAVMAWSRDDQRLIGYYVADSASARGCCFTASEIDAGSLNLQLVEPPPSYHLLTDFDESPDGSMRCAEAFPGDRRESELSVVRSTNARVPPRRIGLNRVQGDCAFSPNGRWLAYTNPDGLHLTPATLDSTAQQFKLVSEATSQLRWTPDGNEIIYRAGRALFAVRLRFDGNAVEALPPQRLFQHDGFFTTWDSWGGGWDLAPDGRLIVWQGPAQTPARQLRAITHVDQLIARTFGPPTPAR